MPSMRALMWGAIVSTTLGVSATGTGGEIQLHDLEGRMMRPFVPAGTASVIFFVQHDCPISNGYAPEILRLCREYGERGVTCILMYEDVEIGRAGSIDATLRRHLREFRYDDIPAAVDRTRAVARHAQATVTPQAVVVDSTGAIRYSGRIDNFYAALGRPRQQVTEHDLRDALEAVLAGRPVLHARTQAIGCHIVDPASLAR